MGKLQQMEKSKCLKKIVSITYPIIWPFEKWLLLLQWMRSNQHTYFYLFIVVKSVSLDRCFCYFQFVYVFMFSLLLLGQLPKHVQRHPTCLECSCHCQMAYWSVDGQHLNVYLVYEMQYMLRLYELHAYITNQVPKSHVVQV